MLPPAPLPDAQEVIVTRIYQSLEQACAYAEKFGVRHVTQ